MNDKEKGKTLCQVFLDEKMLSSKSKSRTKPEQKFLWYWKAMQGPPIIEQYKFHPTRKWRSDFALPTHKLLIEIDGGIWINGGHSRGIGKRNDAEKDMEAFKLGWTVIRLIPSQITTKTIEDILKRICHK